MDLTIIVVSWNTRDLLRRCLRSIASTVHRSHETIVVDNASSDGSAYLVTREFPSMHLIRNTSNRGFAAANNQGFLLSKGGHVLLLNSDAELHPGTADGLIAFLEAHPQSGAAACRLLNEDGSLQRSCRKFPTYLTLLSTHSALRYRGIGRHLLDRWHMREWDHRGDRDVDQPAAACLMIRRDVLDRIGYFDEGCFLLYNDVDLCRRIRSAGYSIAYRSALTATHTASASLSRYEHLDGEARRNVLHYVRKYYGPLCATAFDGLLRADRLWARLRVRP